MAQDHSVFSNIQDNRTSSLAEQVADQINQVIIDQNINAGEKLPNEFELAARLNVGCWWPATVWRSAGARAPLWWKSRVRSRTRWDLPM